MKTLSRKSLLVAAVLGILLLGGGYVAYRIKRAPLTHERAFALGGQLLEKGQLRESYRHFAYAAQKQPQDPNYHWHAALGAQKLGLLQTAADHATEAWSRGLKNKDVFLMRAASATGSRQERLGKSLEWLRELPETRDRRELEGDLYQAAGESRECLRIWTELFDAAPDPGLANKISLVHVGLGRPESAEELLKSSRTGGRLDEEGFGLLASLAAYRDDATEAEAVFAEGRIRFPSSDSLRLNEGVFRIWQDRLSDAAALLDPLKESAKDRTQSAIRGQARIFLGFIAAATNDRTTLERLEALAQGEGPALEGERLYCRGLKEQSLETLKKARSLLATHPAVEWSYARALARSGSWLEASAAYGSVAGLVARAPILSIEHAYALRRAGKFDEAFALLGRLHSRRYYSKGSLELFRDIAADRGLARESAEAQTLLEQKFRDDPSVALAGGVLAMRSGQLAEAASILDALSARHPERADVEVARLSALFARKDYEGVLKAAATSKAPAAALAPIQAAALVMLKRDGDAMALYEKTLADRRDPLTVLSYANLLLRLEKPDRAAEWYHELLRLQPKHPLGELGLATIELRRRNLKAARSRALAAASSATLAYAHVVLAEIELEEKRPDRALAACTQALGIDSKDDRARFLLGVCQLEMGRYDDAESVLSRFAAERPDSGTAQWHLARLRMARGAFGEALQVVDAALSRGLPGAESFRTLRVVLLSLMRRNAEAHDEFARLSPGLPAERVALCQAWLLQQEGRTADAISRLRDHLQDPHVAISWAELTLSEGTDQGVIEALDRHTFDAPRWGRMGELARQKTLLKTAAACYRRGLRFEPENPQLLNNYAFASLQLESFDEADVLAAARKAVTLMPANASVVHTYATVLLRCRQEKECVDLLDKSPSLLQRSARLLLAHATAHERLENWTPAMKSYQACLAHPETESVRAGDLSRLAIQEHLDRVRARVEKR